MRYYYGKNKAKAKEISLYDLLIKELSKNHENIESGIFSDLSSQWININQRVKDDQITVVLSFDPMTDEITNTSVYKSPYKLCEDDMIKII